jgi:hypothetical protein
MRRTSGAIVQRDEGESPTVPEATVPSPDVNVESVDVEDESQLDSTFASSPSLVNGLFSLDPTRFNIYLSPISPVGVLGPLAPVPPASSTFFPTIPSSLQSSSTPPASVPSEFSLYSAGLFQFRLVFEEPKLNVSEALRESEQRFSQFVSPPSEGIDTGKLIKGLITNFLVTTPPGQAILQGVTGAFGGSDGPTSGPTVNLNLDVLPSPILEGQAPGVMLNVQGSF